jgi:hypothetical protein
MFDGHCRMNLIKFNKSKKLKYEQVHHQTLLPTGVFNGHLRMDLIE